MEASWWTGCRGRSGLGIHASCASDLGAWVDDGATNWIVQIQTGKGLRRNTENLEATRGNLGWDIHLEISHRSQRMWKRSRLQRHFRSQQCAAGVVLEGMVTKLQEGPWGMSIWGLSGENSHQGDREGAIEEVQEEKQQCHESQVTSFKEELHAGGNKVLIKHLSELPVKKSPTITSWAVFSQLGWWSERQSEWESHKHREGWPRLMRTWAGELDRGAAASEHGRTYWEKKKLEQL